MTLEYEATMDKSEHPDNRGRRGCQETRGLPDFPASRVLGVMWDFRVILVVLEIQVNRDQPVSPVQEVTLEHRANPAHEVSLVSLVISVHQEVPVSQDKMDRLDRPELPEDKGTQDKEEILDPLDRLVTSVLQAVLDRQVLMAFWGSLDSVETQVLQEHQAILDRQVSLVQLVQLGQEDSQVCPEEPDSLVLLDLQDHLDL